MLMQPYPCRYADVIVHRLLGAALALSVLPTTIKDPQALRSLADNLNNRHRNAQFAGRASVELYTLMYFKDRTILADARITKVGTWTAARVTAKGCDWTSLECPVMRQGFGRAAHPHVFQGWESAHKASTALPVTRQGRASVELHTLMYFKDRTISAGARTWIADTAD